MTDSTSRGPRTIPLVLARIAVAVLIAWPLRRAREAAVVTAVAT